MRFWHGAVQTALIQSGRIPPRRTQAARQTRAGTLEHFVPSRSQIGGWFTRCRACECGGHVKPNGETERTIVQDIPRRGQRMCCTWHRWEDVPGAKGA